MKKILLSKIGFSLIELIVVIAILGVLVSIGAPSYVGYVKKTKKQVCNTNIDTLMRTYKFLHTDGKNITLEGFMAGETSADISNVKCGEGGVYSVVNGKIVCSVHSAQDIKGEGEEADGNSPEGEEESINENLAFTSSNGIPVYVSGSWEAIKQDAGNNDGWGVLLKNGTVLRDETGVYVVKESPWLSRQQSSSNISLSQMTGVQKIDPSARVFTESDYDNNQKKWINPPTKGTLYKYNNEIYMCAYSSNQWTTNDVNSGVWIKLDGQNMQ